jgi:hypothetical protein
MRPFWKVDDAVPFPVTKRLPTMARAAPGEVVPIPTFPFVSMMKAVEVAPAVVEVEMSTTGAD